MNKKLEEIPDLRDCYKCEGCGHAGKFHKWERRYCRSCGSEAITVEIDNQKKPHFSIDQVIDMSNRMSALDTEIEYLKAENARLKDGREISDLRAVLAGAQFDCRQWENAYQVAEQAREKAEARIKELEAQIEETRKLHEDAVLGCHCCGNPVRFSNVFLTDADHKGDKYGLCNLCVK